MNQLPTPPSPDYPGIESPTDRPPAAQRVAVQMPGVQPIATYALLGFTILVFLAQMASQSLLGGDLPAALGLKVNDLIAQGELWRLITPMFLHASILHIGFNMYALYIFGPGLERHFGHTRFLALYFLGGFAGNVLSMIFSPVPSLGSSTAIFGLLGAEGVFLYQNRKLFASFAQRALINIILIGAINLFIGLAPGIDNWGHLGGLIAGTLFTWLGGPLLEVQGILPNLSVVDRRESREVLLAGLVVGVLFAAAAGVTIYLRGG